MNPTTDLPSDDYEVLDSTLLEVPEDIPESLWKKWIDDANKQDNLAEVDRILEQAMKGTNWGIPTGLETLDKHMHGIQKARYYLIGAESGAGKTTVGDFIYVFQLWQNARKAGRKVKIFYCSFEIGKTEKIFRWMSYFIWIKFKVRLPSFYLQGHIHGVLLTEEHKKMADWAKYQVKAMLEDIRVLEDSIHPTAIYQSMIMHFEANGTVTREVLTKEEIDSGRHPRILEYKEKDPQLLTVLIIDHLALTGPEMGLDTKRVMDKMSRYGIVLRNMFKCSLVFLQQFSTEMLGTFREMAVRKGDVTVLKPSRLDFGDSKATFRDADLVLALMKPAKDVPTYLGYHLQLTKDELGDAQGLGDNFTAGYIIKHRYGNSNRLIPLFVDGSVGDVESLPTQGQGISFVMQEWYDKAAQIEALCQVYSPKSA